MKLDGQSFQNSDTCQGMAYVADAPLDIAQINIDGRYPESGWAVNHECHEMVRVSRGIGEVTINSMTTELSEGDVVYIPPNTAFAWSGEMVITMACSPPFYPEQYELTGGKSTEETK